MKSALSWGVGEVFMKSLIKQFGVSCSSRKDDWIAGVKCWAIIDSCTDADKSSTVDVWAYIA